MKEVLLIGKERYDNDPTGNLIKGKASIGKIQFATLRKIFEVIKRDITYLRMTTPTELIRINYLLQ